MFLKQKRKEKILQHVYKHGQATVSELCRLFGSSEATIRRDLEDLAANDLLRRIHGGVALLDAANFEPRIFQRRYLHAEEKQKIGITAARLVEDGETVLLGIGSTVMEVAKHLKKRSDLTVISNSLPIINFFSDSQNVKVIVGGGYLRNPELSMIGHTVQSQLVELRADKAIMGIQRIHLECGLTNDYLPETATDRVLFRFARRLILVADHSKFGVTKNAFVDELSVVDTIVTDRGLPAEYREGLKKLGIEVVLADN